MSFSKSQVLQISYKGEPLTLAATDEVLSKLTWQDVELLSLGQPKGFGTCKDGMFRGQGTCIAKKFLNYGPTIEFGCNQCVAQEIVNQLNYIFDRNYNSEYFAEWRKKKSYNRRKKDEIQEPKKKEKPKRNLKPVEPDVYFKKPKSIKEKKILKKQKPNSKPKEDINRLLIKRGRGRPRKIQTVIVVKRGRGRPKGSKKK